MQMEKHLLQYYLVQMMSVFLLYSPDLNNWAWSTKVIYPKNIHTGQHASKISYLVLKIGFDWFV